MAYQLEAIHDALRSEIGSEIGVKAGAAIDALILRDLAIEPTLSARRLAERRHPSQHCTDGRRCADHLQHAETQPQLGKQGLR